MKGRCYNPKNQKYKNYGLRGIVVCDEWKDNFLQFLEDMGQRPSKIHSVDRIDVNGPYSKENCRWALPEVQQHNKTNTLLVDTPFGRIHFRELSRKTGIAYACLRTRYYRDGLRGEELISA